VVGTQDEFEKAAEEVRKLFNERGSKTLKEVAASVLQEKIECDEVKGALSHFISYWRDVVRPSLVSLACEAVGGDPSIAAPMGKSLTLLSGATDIHDDIIDKTMVKEKRKTVLGGFGGDIALLAGDALICEGLIELFEGLARLDIPPEKKLDIVHTVRGLYCEMLDGEALELRFRARTDVKPDEYLHVVRKKAADVEACMRVGAMLGNGSEEQVNAVGGYGRLLGTMVLLRDDLEDMLDLNLLDLRIKNESLPLPILYALQNDEKKEEILSILKKEKVSREEAESLLKLVSEARGVNKLEKLFMGIKNQAWNKIEKIKSNRVFRTILEATVPREL
jgi:geranylgeranyl diphosphate synthase type I